MIKEFNSILRLKEDSFCIEKNHNMEEIILINCNQARSFTDIGVESKFEDKTAIEAFYNHIHIVDNINVFNFWFFKLIGKYLIKIASQKLIKIFPNKKFIVYISVDFDGGMIFRFHQEWKGEYKYYEPNEFNSKRCVIYEQKIEGVNGN